MLSWLVSGPLTTSASSRFSFHPIPPSWIQERSFSLYGGRRSMTNSPTAGKKDFGGNRTGLRWENWVVLSRLGWAHERVIPPLSRKVKYCLRCRWSPLARPRIKIRFWRLNLYDLDHAVMCILGFCLLVFVYLFVFVVNVLNLDITLIWLLFYYTKSIYNKHFLLTTCPECCVLNYFMQCLVNVPSWIHFYLLCVRSEHIVCVLNAGELFLRG